jgi:hypothetical protein
MNKYRSLLSFVLLPGCNRSFIFSSRNAATAALRRHAFLVFANQKPLFPKQNLRSDSAILRPRRLHTGSSAQASLPREPLSPDKLN